MRTGMDAVIVFPRGVHTKHAGIRMNWAMTQAPPLSKKESGLLEFIKDGGGGVFHSTIQ